MGQVPQNSIVRLIYSINDISLRRGNSGSDEKIIKKGRHVTTFSCLHKKSLSLFFRVISKSVQFNI